MARRKRGKDGIDVGAAEPAGTPLCGELLHKGLGEVSRTADGSGYAFTKLTCCGKGVTTLPENLQQYVHLRYIDISGNKVKDLTPFSKLPHLLTLNAAANNIENLSCLSSPEALPYLSLLNVSSNRISTAPQLLMKRLTRLALDANPIASLEGFVAPPSLTHLSLRGTPIESLDSLPPSDTLTSIYLSHTPMQQLRQLQQLPQVTTLDLEGVPLPPDQLLCLTLLPRLKEVSLTPPDPDLTEEQFRAEILKVLPRLHWINGRSVTPDELRTARALREADFQQQKQLERHSDPQQAAEGTAAPGS